MTPVSKSSPALQRKRLTSALLAASLCALIGACGDDAADDRAADTTMPGSPDRPADPGKVVATASANPSQSEPAPPALTIRTPALPASNTGAALATVATARLAAPVIHTVD